MNWLVFFGALAFIGLFVAHAALTLESVPMGGQVGADPEEHPRWDGEKILPYGETANDQSEPEEETA